MNYWKKMAFALALVAGLCGGAWAQDWGHRDRDHDKNNQKWRDRDHDRDRDRWRREHDYRYRNGQWGYQNRGSYPYYPNGTYYPNQSTWGYGSGYPGTWGYPGTGGYGAGTPGYGSGASYQAGYRDGLMIGRNDRMQGRKYQPAQYKAYKNGDMSYKQGFGIGYDRGYGRYSRGY